MSVIKNVCILDVRNIKEDLAKEISEIKNVQILIESDKSQSLLKNCTKENIMSTLKLQNDIKIINYSGELVIDKEYLDGFPNGIVLLVNGSVVFKDDVNREMIEDKIYFMLVNGEVICAKKLSSSIQAKGQINGQVVEYNTGYIFFYDGFRLTNSFLRDLPPKSKLSFRKLMILEDIDKNIFEDKIDKIQIIDKLVIKDECKDIVSKYIDDYYLIDKIVLPKGAKYIDDSILIDSNSIQKYESDILFVDGEVKILSKENIELEKYIKTLYCDKIICNDKNYPNIKKVLGDDNIQIDIINGKMIENTGKLTFSNDMNQIEEKVTIKNMGKLIFEEDIDINEFNKNVDSIINYGAIEAPKELIGVVNSKIKENKGVVKTSKQEILEEIQDKEQEEKILYANLLHLKL